MTSRRKFIQLSALGSLFIASTGVNVNPRKRKSKPLKSAIKPVVISTWNHGLAANQGAWVILSKQGNALDAVEAGVKVAESDSTNKSVGIGGLPDRDGNVTLDACIMNEKGDCGAVAFLKEIENPISVARKVMEDTPHVMLVGKGAQEFAVEKGFERKNLLTPQTEKIWRDWLKKSEYQPVINSENHDTIGMLALDEHGNLSGACTTSGMAYKLHGRVGDSPIIGAGLFVDNEVGAACATGVGEAVIRVAGSHLVVELMRQGYSPEEACKMATERIIQKHESLKNLQVGFLALDKYGRHGGYSVYNGFNYALKTKEEEKMVDTKFDRSW